MSGYLVDDATAEEIAAERSTYEPVTQATRRLADLCVRSQVGPEQSAQALEHIEAAIALLGAQADPEPYGLRHSSHGFTRPWGNAVVGVRNPIAPPLEIRHEEDRVTSDFELSSVYEGPPSLVHGGVSALLLDQLLGEAAAAAGSPGMTGTLTVRYRRATPLGRLYAEAWVDRVEGVKTFALGHIRDDEGICVEAEGVFIVPRWARAGEDRRDRFE